MTLVDQERWFELTKERFGEDIGDADLLNPEVATRLFVADMHALADAMDEHPEATPEEKQKLRSEVDHLVAEITGA